MTDEPKSSWLDEVSVATKIVVVVTIVSVLGFALLKIVELLV